MNIVFFTDSFFPTINGVSTTILYYANGLVEEGHKVMIVAPKHKQEFKAKKWGLNSKVKLYFLPSVDARVYPDIRLGLPTTGLLRVVDAFHPDLLHICTPFLVGSHGVLLGKGMGIPLVASHMTNYSDQEVLKVFGRAPNPFTRTALQGAEALLKTFLQRHKAIVVPTEYTKQYLLERHLKSPIYVVPSPVDTKALRAGKSAGVKLKSQLGIQQSLIYVGRLSAEKNVDLLLKTFAELVSQAPHLRLVLVGDGPERNRLFSQAGRMGISKSIVWTGSVEHREVVLGGYYYLGDVFVTLSMMETQGLSTSEAMACGLPVVGTKGVGTEETIGSSGVLVDPHKITETARTILKLFRDAKERERLALLSQQSARVYELTACVKKLESVYTAVLNGRGKESHNAEN